MDANQRSSGMNQMGRNKTRQIRMEAKRSNPPFEAYIFRVEKLKAKRLELTFESPFKCGLRPL